MATFTGTRTSGNPTITSVPDTSALVIGVVVTGTGIQVNSVINSFVANTSVTLSLNASSSGSGTYTTWPQTIVFTGAITSGNPTVLSVADTSFLSVGQRIVGVGIQDNSLINSIVTNTSITLNKNATATNAAVTLSAWPLKSFSANPQTSLSPTAALSVKRTIGFAAAPAAALVVLAALSGATKGFAAVPSTALDVTARLSGKTQSFAGKPITGLQATVAKPIGRTASFQGTPTTGLQATITSVFGRGAVFTARPVTSLTALASLKGSPVTFMASPETMLRASLTLTGAQDAHGMTLCTLVDEILAMWGIFSRCSAPDYVLSRAVADVNDSLQLVWNNAAERSYWTKATVSLTFGIGITVADLEDDIQNVIGPCRTSTGRSLAIVGTLGDIESFSDFFMDGETAAEPLAYFVDRRAQDDTEPCRCRVIISPPPTASTVLDVEVVKEAPRFALGDLHSCPLMPIPHQYVESLLRPVARYKASTYTLFMADSQKDTIDREYLQAAGLLGLADPLPGDSGENRDRREAKKS